jgi:hypothetical protein
MQISQFFYKMFFPKNFVGQVCSSSFKISMGKTDQPVEPTETNSSGPVDAAKKAQKMKFGNFSPSE